MTSHDAPRIPGTDTPPRSEAAAAPAADTHGVPALVPMLEAICREIAERQGTEGLPAAAAESAIGIALCTLEGRFIEVNEALVGLSGYTPAEIVGRTGQEVGLWSNPEEMLRCIRQRGSVDEYVLPYKTRDGRTRRMLLAARLLTVNRRGCILAVGVDVTDRTGFAYEATL